MSEAEKISGHASTAFLKETEGGVEELGPCTQPTIEGPSGHSGVDTEVGTKEQAPWQPVHVESTTSTEAPLPGSQELRDFEQVTGQSLSSLQEVLSISISAVNLSRSPELSAKEQAAKKVKALLLPSKTRLDGTSLGLDQLGEKGRPKVIEDRPDFPKLRSSIVIDKTDTSADPKGQNVPGAQTSSSLPSSLELPPTMPKSESLIMVQESTKSKKKSHKSKTVNKKAPFRREG